MTNRANLGKHAGGFLVLLCAVTVSAAESVSQDERDALLAVRDVQARCVVALNEAFLAAEEARRAQQHRAQWRSQSADPITTG